MSTKFNLPFLAVYSAPAIPTPLEVYIAHDGNAEDFESLDEAGHKFIATVIERATHDFNENDGVTFETHVKATIDNIDTIIKETEQLPNFIKWL